MIHRFQGDEGRRRLLQELQQQEIVQGNKDFAQDLINAVDVIQLAQGDVLIKQGADDNDLYFIVAGSLSVKVHNREVARRRHRQHVGEMGVIDPAERRSATVIAAEVTVVAKVTEPKFTAVAARHPELWRNLASKLAERLRQRNNLVRPMNLVPRMFVGSSVEGLSIARELQAGLQHDPVVVTLWTDRVFSASTGSLEALEKTLEQSDFAALVLTPDDLVLSRDKLSYAPRDNVIFELGQFFGGLRRGRTFMVLPRGMDIKIPTDLLGITPITYGDGDAQDLAARIGPVCTELRKQVQEKGPR